jgi:hypothetical protein
MFRFAVPHPELSVFANFVGGMPAVVCLEGGLAGWIQRRGSVLGRASQSDTMS